MSIDVCHVIDLITVRLRELDQEGVNSISPTNREHVAVVFHAVDNGANVPAGLGATDEFHVDIVRNVQRCATHGVRPIRHRAGDGYQGDEERVNPEEAETHR